MRIAKLLRAPEEYDGWKVNQRAPVVGDVGALLDIVHGPGLENRYIVECCGQDGVTIWLHDFAADELEAVRAASDSPES